jgi:SAM-dependent methyltransferase
MSSTYHASDGAAYERFLGRWTRRLARGVIEAVAPPDGEALDVACGTGSLALELAATRKVVGVDIAEPYIGYARERAPPNATFVTADACDLPFDDKRFAVAIAQLALNFVPDADAALAEMLRVVRPGGVVAAAVWDFRGGLVYQRLFWDSAAGIDPAAAEARDRLFSAPLALPDGLPTLFRAGGVAAVESRSVTIRMDYADFADYWDPLLGGQGPVGTYVARLSADMRERIRGQVRSAYLSGAADGPRSLAASAWVVRGRVS